MSVPASLSTGADSPVMADSLTKAAPSITSPSAGMTLSFSPDDVALLRSPLPGTDFLVPVLEHAPDADKVRPVRRNASGLCCAAFGERLGKLANQTVQD